MNLLTKLKSTASFQLDLSANLVGMGWSALVQFVCIPFYIKFLGVEGYGLVGYYVMLQAMLQVLDLGITPTINRELARYSVRPEMAPEARDLVRTIEVGYWVIGALIGMMIMGVAPFIASHWIHAAGIPVDHVRQAVMAMGILLVFRWPVAFYQAGLIGLHRQVLVNAINIGAATLSGGGALVVLWLVSATARSFFLWQAAIAAVQAAVLLGCLWHTMPLANQHPRLNFKLLRGVSRFAAGMSGITVSAMILTQLDKLIISRLFSLEVFGYYTLAGVFGKALIMVVTPVFNTIFPRFSALAAANEEAKLTDLYHRCSQLMAVLIMPATAVLALYSYEILLVWTGNSVIAHNSAPIATVLAIATALNGLMNLPYVLQLAHGWTIIGLQLNVFFMLILVPAIWVLATRYGPIGGSFAYLAFMCTYMALGVPLTHRRLLRGAARQWFATDVGLAAIAALLVVGVARALPLPMSSSQMAVASLSVVLIAGLLAAALAAPLVRAGLLAQFVMTRSTNVESGTTTVTTSIGSAPDPIISDLPPIRPK